MGIPDPVLHKTKRFEWDIPPAPSDPILALHEAYQEACSPHAINLSVGAYRDGEGRAHEFRSVREARMSLSCTESYDHGYLPISGLKGLSSLSARLIFGDGPVDAGRVACIHTVSGSCALRLGLAFASQVLGAGCGYISTPAWPNHGQMVPAEGLKLGRYRYYDSNRRGVDVEGMIEDLENAKHGDVVVMQPCGHNPTGADLTEEEWGRVAEIVKKRGLVAVFDMAYQGLASGDLERDAYAVRLFVSNGINVIVAQSYSKNLGLYNSRVGSVDVCVTEGVHMVETVANVKSQLCWLARGIYSSPPAHGGRIAERVLGEKGLRAEWESEIGDIVGRMRRMRMRLREELERRGVCGEWEHLTRTRGMFALLGLSEGQVAVLRCGFGIYMTKDSRINVAGLTEGNVERVAQAVAEVVGVRRA